ncbi:ribulokinase [Echinicola jeungdonensis]|uniref:Ribulokinase n=1 Tax=Echinicola jeungdonensis TaxID=709343 RepID=A0ABV5J1H6_9BACT|nr:ribulokinase [Echinicola jeungdonensis]MDN3668512.1 ribulokinase [Echinicola jeungdonensis]
MKDNFVIGLDYGSDSVRAVIVNAGNGEVKTSHVFWYPRWKEGKYCDPVTNQFRQHPLDHFEGLEVTIKAVVNESGIPADQIKGICVDTTGSSPMAVDKKGKPLAFTPEFAENPNALMVLWKDHTAIKEADEINELARNWGGEDFTKYEGGIYSSEWFWAKILHVIREDKAVSEAAYSWVEHCDVITAELTGANDPLEFKRSRCAAGHKALWHESWDGLPPKEFLGQLDPRLADLRDRLYTETYTSDLPAGKLSPEWAKKLGLNEDTVVAVGTFDAHAGAVGGEVAENTLVKVMGTSTCDIMVASYDAIGDNLVKGICGQVDGSVIPGTIGLEAGQSGFGDVLAWFKKLLIEPAAKLIRASNKLDDAAKESLIHEMDDNLLIQLTNEALEIPLSETAPVALDWVNGRRTPDANQSLKGALMGLNMGTDAARVFKALVESICFGSKKIVDRFKEEGVQIDTVIGMGGVAKKSKLVMQTMADVLNMPIKIATSDQAPALGAAMYASVAAGIHPDTETAIATMTNGFDAVYEPNPENVEVYEKLYEKYEAFGDFVEGKKTIAVTN